MSGTENTHTVCYICGRDEATVRKFEEPILHGLENDILQAEQALRDAKVKYETKYRRVIEAVRGANLDFSVRTVKTDITAFAKIIPCLDDLFAFFNEKMKTEERRHQYPYENQSEDIKLIDIVKKIEAVDDPQIHNLQKRVEYAKERKLKYLEHQKYYTLSLHKQTLTLERIFRDTFPTGRRNRFSSPEEKARDEYLRQINKDIYSLTKDEEQQMKDIMKKIEQEYSDMGEYNLPKLSITVHVCSICEELMIGHGKSAYYIIKDNKP